jgi:hypothetical protein
MKTSRCILSVLALVALEHRAEAAPFLIAPAFDGAPAVVATGSLVPGTINGSTVIFGRRNGGIQMVARQGSNSVWAWGLAELIVAGTPGSADSDPAAVYLDNTRIMVCFHQGAAPGHFYCSIGQVNRQNGMANTPVLFPVSHGPAPAAGGIFAPTTSPVIVKNGSTVFLFGRGTDNQIWFATGNTTGAPQWQGWFQIPPFSGGFGNDPAAAVIDSSGTIEVCAAASFGVLTYCNKRSPNGTWGGWFSVFMANTFHRPAMTRSANAVWFLTTGNDPDTHMFGRFSVAGGVNWSSEIQAGAGYGFSAPPAAVATTSTQSVFLVGRGGDTRFYTNYLGTQPWTQLQALSPYPGN